MDKIIVKPKKFNESSAIKTFTIKELGAGDLSIFHKQNNLPDKCTLSYYDTYGSGISVFINGTFLIKRGSVFIATDNKHFVMFEFDKIKYIELKKDGTYFYDVYLKNGLYATIDLG